MENPDTLRGLSSTALHTIHRKLFFLWMMEKSWDETQWTVLVRSFNKNLFLKTQEFCFVGDVYEIDALYAVLQSDLKAFRRAISVVMNFYDCYRYFGSVDKS